MDRCPDLVVKAVGLGGSQARQVEAGMVTGEGQETVISRSWFAQDLGLNWF